MDSPLSALAADLMWSLWTELGIPGILRNHAGFAIDPEPLIVVTPRLAGDDLRLVEEALRWCQVHGHRVSIGRLKALFTARSADTRAHFSDFAVSLAEQGGPRWPRSGDLTTRFGKISGKVPPLLPVDRAALVRFRLRGLSGLGARADVLAELLARTGRWTGPGDLPDIGYTRRAISDVLADLAETGLVNALSEGRAIRYRLAEPSALAQLVGPLPGHFPWWSAIFLLVELGLELDRSRERPANIRRVLANITAERILERLAMALELNNFPKTKENIDYYDVVMDWISTRVQEIVLGRSPALELVPTGRYLIPRLAAPVNA